MKTRFNIDNKLVIIYESEQERNMLSDWYVSALRQYKHNDDSPGFVTALDMDSIILKREID